MGGRCCTAFPLERTDFPVLRAALLILSGNAAASLLLLARNLIIARLIPMADYGIAATFAIAMSVVEMMSALGLQQQIVQAKNGEDPRLQAALQGFQVLRGVISGAVLYVLAGPIADFLQVPQAAWAYRVMALVPVLNALVHFDIYRLNRQMNFAPMLWTGGVPALASVLAVWPLSLWYGDYKVMLYAVLVQAGLTVLTSHLVASRPYRLVLDRAIMGQSLKFGWPLLVEGILLFAVFQGDKLIVGRELGMEALAIFAMGFTLTLTPTLVLEKSAQNFFLPQLAGVDRGTQAGEAHFTHLAMVTFQCHMLFGTLIVIAVMALGEPVVDLLLGEKYAAVVPILTWLAIMQALRVFKGGPSTVALARGMTKNAMIANLVRVASLPLAWWVAVSTGNIFMIIAISLAGEFVGFIVALSLARWRVRLRLRPLVWPVGISMGLLGVAAVHAWEQQNPGVRIIGPLWTLGAAALLGAACFIVMRDFRKYIATRGQA